MLQRSGLAFSARRQIGVAVGNFARGDSDVVGDAANLADRAPQRIAHAADRLHQAVGIVPAGADGNGEVPGRNCLGDLGGIARIATYRALDAAVGERHEQRKQHRQHEEHAGRRVKRGVERGIDIVHIRAGCDDPVPRCITHHVAELVDRPGRRDVRPRKHIVDEAALRRLSS